MGHTCGRVNGATLVPAADAAGPIPVGSAAWFAWLEDATAFTFTSPSGSFSARKERRTRGGWYWQAYRTANGALHKAYLGKRENLTLERLERAAAALARASPRADPLPVAPPSSASAAMPLNLLTTKLFVPPAHERLVPRPRLTDWLQHGVHRPLTLIAAPAGFGKTTLLASWLEHAPLRSAWVSLEHDDDDLTRFWTYVFAAITRVSPGSGTDALALLQPLAPSPLIETVLTAWINALADLPHAVALVLDDYHLIAAPAIHRSLAYLVDHLPPRLHLIIATRADPPLPLARLRARGSLTEIRAADLRFTMEETAAFLARQGGPAFADAEIAALAARTEGWVAGLQLAALSMHGHDDIPGFLRAFTGSHRYIVDYLVEEVLARQPEPVQTFLLRTAILERLHASLCTAVLGLADEPAGASSGQALLQRVEAANLFLTPLDDERQWYRYHQLFAEALRHRLRQWQPALVPELHRRASGWYAERGLPRDAVHHALAAADFEGAARLMEHVVNTLVAQGEIAMLRRWVAALPRELVCSHVEIALWQGWLLFVDGQYDEALRHLRQIEHTSGVEGGVKDGTEQPLPGRVEHPDAVHGRIAAIRASIALIRRDLPRAVALSRQALAYLPRESMARAYVAWYLGKARWLDGDLAAARAALEEAARVCREVGHLYALFLVTHDLARLHIQQGRLHQADQLYRQALHEAQERRGHPPAMGPACVGRGNLAREWNHLDEASSLLQEGIVLCEQTANPQAMLEGLVGLAFVHQARGDAEGARVQMRRAAELQEQQRDAPSGGMQVDAEEAWLALMQGDEAAATRWAQHGGLDVDQVIDHLRERSYLTLVRLLIAQHRPGEALEWLAKLLPSAEAQGRTSSVIEIFMLQAQALHASGEENQALERLARALVLAEPEGYVRLFVDEGALMARLLARMRAHTSGHGSPSVHYRDHLLSLLGGAPSMDVPHMAGPETGVDLPIERLSDRELEVLRLIVAGCSNREIAEQLVLAVSTVKWYANTIYAKLQVKSRTRAIARARELHIA